MWRFIKFVCRWGAYAFAFLFYLSMVVRFADGDLHNGIQQLAWGTVFLMCGRHLRPDRSKKKCQSDRASVEIHIADDASPVDRQSAKSAGK